MNGMEFGKELCYGCDVFAAGNTMVQSIRAEGETCEVTLADGTPATLYSEGTKQGFYIQFPLRLPEGVERYYPFAKTGNSFLRFAHGIARAT